MTRLRTVAVVAALAVACSSGSPPRETTTTSATPATTSTSAATTTTAAGGCGGTAPAPLATAPPTTVRPSQVSADVDGDGRQDKVTVFGTGTDRAPGPWFVSVEPSSGAKRVAPITDADPNDPDQRIRVLGVAVAGAGPVVFVVVGTGASATIIGLFQLVGCDLARVLTEPGAPATFTVGGTVTHLDGVRCRPGGIDVLSAKSADGMTYSGTITGAVVADGNVVPGQPMPVEQISAQDLPMYGSLDCPDVERI